MQRIAGLLAHRAKSQHAAAERKFLSQKHVSRDVELCNQRLVLMHDRDTVGFRVARIA